MAVKTPSAVLAEWEKFRANIPPSTPYENLLGIAAEAKYAHQLREKNIVVMPDNGLLVSFDLLIGNETNPLEFYDTVSIRLNAAPGPVSFAARVQLLPTLIYMFFGRMPPSVARPAPVEQTIDMSDAEGDIVLPDDFDAPPASEAEDRGFTEAPPFVPVEPADIDVVDHREPDGVPIFKDLYDSFDDSIPATTVIAAMLAVIEPFSIRASSKEQLLALYTKNADINQFMLDFGTPEERARLKEVLDRALARLSEPAREVRLPPGGPRRRSKAA